MNESYHQFNPEKGLYLKEIKQFQVGDGAHIDFANSESGLSLPLAVEAKLAKQRQEKAQQKLDEIRKMNKEGTFGVPGRIAKIRIGGRMMTMDKYAEQFGHYPTLSELVISPRGKTKIAHRADIDLRLSKEYIDSYTQNDLFLQENPHLKFPFSGNHPIFSAPMDSITDGKVARILASKNIVSCLPRAKNLSEHEANKQLAQESAQNNYPWVFSVGVNGLEGMNAFEEAKQLVEAGAKMILVDTAHGGQERVGNLAVKIQSELKVPVIVGSLGSFDQAKELYDRGIRYFRFGVGSGAYCTTSMTTAVGSIPTMASELTAKLTGSMVILDGGLNTQTKEAYYIDENGKTQRRQNSPTYRNIPASFTLNENPDNCITAIMCGSSLRAIDSPRVVQDENGNYWHNGRGQASRDYSKESGVNTEASTYLHEGVSDSTLVGDSLEKRADEIIAAWRSASSYAGAENLEQYYKNTILVPGGSLYLGTYARDRNGDK